MSKRKPRRARWTDLDGPRLTAKEREPLEELVPNDLVDDLVKVAERLAGLSHQETYVGGAAKLALAALNVALTCRVPHCLESSMKPIEGLLMRSSFDYGFAIPAPSPTKTVDVLLRLATSYGRRKTDRKRAEDISTLVYIATGHLAPHRLPDYAFRESVMLQLLRDTSSKSTPYEIVRQSLRLLGLSGEKTNRALNTARVREKRARDKAVKATKKK